MQGTIDLAFWLTLSFAVFLLLLPMASDTCRLKPTRSLEHVHGSVALQGSAGPGAATAGNGTDSCNRRMMSASRRPAAPHS
jgi:hypothetical protein